jgi:hypothetical protein
MARIVEAQRHQRGQAPLASEQPGAGCGQELQPARIERQRRYRRGVRVAERDHRQASRQHAQARRHRSADPVGNNLRHRIDHANLPDR